MECDSGLEYPQGSELGPWIATIRDNGELHDFSVVWNFRVQVQDLVTGAVLVDKNTGIVGAADGVVTVNWSPGELDDLDLGRYPIRLRAFNTALGTDLIISDTIRVTLGLVLL